MKDLQGVILNEVKDLQGVILNEVKDLQGVILNEVKDLQQDSSGYALRMTLGMDSSFYAR